jgi:23S rRNA pseudouridine1911/1915/1917 synthase
MSHRTFVVPPPEAGQPLLGWLARQLQRPQDELRPLFAARRVTINGNPADPKQKVRAGQRVEVPREFGARGRKFLPLTLADLLPGLLREIDPGKAPVVRAVHRLDKETSGLVVFARTIPAERHLGQQFRVHSIERVYLALVRGHAKEGRIESALVRDRGDGRRGSGSADEGQRAVTHVHVVERLGDYTLIECRLETGRTHQVRIHLGEAGTPLCGERIYDRPLHGRPLPDGSGARRVLLHAQTLALDHPTTGARLRWTSRPPRDFEAILKRLRHG